MFLKYEATYWDELENTKRKAVGKAYGKDYGDAVSHIVKYIGKDYIDHLTTRYDDESDDEYIIVEQDVKI